MQTSTRKGIALIAASLVNHRWFDLVRCSGDEHATRFTGRVGRETNIYDYDRRENIVGTMQDGQYALIDSESITGVSLRLNGLTFSGTDALSGKDFHGTVDGHEVALFDYETHAFYEFSVQADGRTHAWTSRNAP